MVEDLQQIAPDVTPEVVLGRLTRPDAGTVRQVASRLRSLVKSSGGESFGALYVVGGALQGPNRPDTDLVIVANLPARTPYTPPDYLKPQQQNAVAEVSLGNRVVGAIAETLVRRYELGPMDSSHDMGCESKLVFGSQPKARTEHRKPLDISIVDANRVKGGIRDTNHFETDLDIDLWGRPLSRLKLAEYNASGRTLRNR